MKPVVDSRIFSKPRNRLYFSKGMARYYTECIPNTVSMKYDYHLPNLEVLSEQELLICTHIGWGIYSQWHYDRREHQRFLGIEIILKGTMFVRSNGLMLLAEPGDVVVMMPNDDHEFMPIGDQPLEKIGIILAGRALEAITLRMRVSSSTVITLSPAELKKFRKITEPLRQAMAVKEMDAEGLLTVSSCSFRVLAALDSLHGIDRQESALYEISSFIEEHLHAEHLLSVTARQFQMSVYQLRKLFSTHYHLPPHKYIMDRRMAKAVVLLLQRKLLVKEIGAAVGYPNQLNFATAFRKYYNCSPSQYLLRYQEQRGRK